MVKMFRHPLRRWPVLEAGISRLASRLRAWPADDFGQFVSPSMGTSMVGVVGAIQAPGNAPRSARPLPHAPAAFEMRFTRLQAEGRFEEMWDMVAEEAQRAWGGREAFVREMPRFDDRTELLDVEAISVALLEGWTDLVHGRTYSNVALLVMRYRMRQDWREWTFDRQVHLVPVAGGWRTLCYPARARTAVGR
jgi:hypothetical protein